MRRTILESAEARRAGVAQRGDRPRQRRCASDVGAPATVRATLLGTELRAKKDGGPLVFEGVASVTETPYVMHDMFGEYHEIVSAGAFGASLSRADLDVPMVIGHDQIRRIARTTNGTLMLSETGEGLHVLAELDPKDADVAYISPKLMSKLIDEMSFAFRIEAGMWSPDYSEFRIQRVDIHRGDVSIVGWGANPNTFGSLREDAAKKSERRGMSYAAALVYTAN